MGGKNKPGPRNAFYYFVSDFKERQGRKIGNFKLAADEAGPLWQNLSKEQKKPYEERAKMEKGSATGGIKYTSKGENVEVIQQQERDRSTKEQNMKCEIEEIVRLSYESGRIPDQLYHLIHVNYFCYCNQDQCYYPAELAISRFSLRDGILPENVYHSIVKTGVLPTGYAAIAKSTAESTHQLPLPESDESNANMVIKDIVAFMQDQDSMPPFFTEAKYIPMVENVLQYLCYEFGYKPDMFKVYSLEHLLYTLRNAVSGQIVWPSFTLSEAAISKDVFDFSKDIACMFHEETGAVNYCSRSYVIRQAYVICDNCCADLHIDLIAGQHVPFQAKRILLPSRPESTVSWKSTRAMRTDFTGSAASYASSVTSERSESRLSQFSEVESVTTQETTNQDYSNHGGSDSEVSQATETDDVWNLAKQKHRRNAPQPKTYASMASSVARGARPKTYTNNAGGGASLQESFQNLNVLQSRTGLFAGGRGRRIAKTLNSGDST